MIQPTGLKPELGTVAQNGLRQARTGGVYSIIQTDQVFATEPFEHLCDYRLPNVFDFLMCQHGSIRLRNTQIESAR